MNLIFRKPIIMILGILITGGIILTSCDDDDAAVPTDFSVLQDSIQVATNLLASTEEGVNDGQYSAASRTALQTAIDAAETVVDNASASQQQVNNAIVALHEAMEAYRESEIAPVAVEALVAHWSFDEGTGTMVHDNSNNGFDGTFKTGHVDWGAGFPVWAEDRHGNTGKAIYFNEGANIEVPYNLALNPKQLTISLWVNVSEILENNRFIGLHSWIAYKFQMNATNVPFFTVSTGENVYINEDAKVALPINQWHHIAVTFGGGKMVFYIDGELSNPDASYNHAGEAVSISDAPYNLVIGQDFPTEHYAATDANFDVDHKIPLAWGGYYHGYLDEMRIYNTPLTASQIKAIYDREKPE